MTSKELSKHYFLELEIKSIQEKIDMLNSTTIGSAKLDGMPKARSNVSPIERIAELIEELEMRLAKRKIESTKAMLRIEKFISDIPEPETRLIFTERYLNFKEWENIGNDNGMSGRTAQRIHKNYLDSIK